MHNVSGFLSVCLSVYSVSNNLSATCLFVSVCPLDCLSFLFKMLVCMLVCLSICQLPCITDRLYNKCISIDVLYNPDNYLAQVVRPLSSANKLLSALLKRLSISISSAIGWYSKTQFKVVSPTPCVELMTLMTIW